MREDLEVGLIYRRGLGKGERALFIRSNFLHLIILINERPEVGIDGACTGGPRLGSPPQHIHSSPEFTTTQQGTHIPSDSVPHL